MNILSSIHLYPPKHNCGAEWMIHHMHKDLQSKGHNIRVVLHQANKYKIENNYCFDGVDVFPPHQSIMENLIRWGDCMFTHLDYTHWTIGWGKMYRKPVFHLIHNSHSYPEIVNAENTQHIIYNSHWLKNKLNYNHPSFVLTPPVDFRYYDTGVDPYDNTYITLINLNENKGGKIFADIAKAMPKKRFLGVLGSYDDQIMEEVPNIKYISNTSDILDVYRQTKILLMPSEYESWGRTATEAMCSGIPVICSEAEGLVENCDNAGIYVKDRNDIKSWVSAIEKLDDKKTYQAVSRKAKARAIEHDPRKKLNEFEAWVKENVKRFNH